MTDCRQSIRRLSSIMKRVLAYESLVCLLLIFHPQDIHADELPKPFPITFEATKPDLPEPFPITFEVIRPDLPEPFPITFEVKRPDLPEPFPITFEATRPDLPEPFPITFEATRPDLPKPFPITFEVRRPDLPEPFPVTFKVTRSKTSNDDSANNSFKPDTAYFVVRVSGSGYTFTYGGGTYKISGSEERYIEVQRGQSASKKLEALKKMIDGVPCERVWPGEVGGEVGHPGLFTSGSQITIIDGPYYSYTDFFRDREFKKDWRINGKDGPHPSEMAKRLECL